MYYGVCTDCGIPSLYYSDMEEHKRQKNHRHVAEFDLRTSKIMTHHKHETA